MVRVAQALIKAPIEEVALCWWQAGRRKVKRAVLSSRHPPCRASYRWNFSAGSTREGVLHRLDTFVCDLHGLSIRQHDVTPVVWIAAFLLARCLARSGTPSTLRTPSWCDLCLPTPGWCICRESLRRAVSFRPETSATSCTSETGTVALTRSSICEHAGVPSS